MGEPRKKSHDRITKVPPLLTLGVGSAGLSPARGYENFPFFFL